MQNRSSAMPIRPSRADWSDLYLFLAVLELGSFRRAATALGSSQSRLSRRLDQLEQRLGVALLERQSNGVTATAAGERARDYVLTMARSAWGLEAELAKLDREAAGEVAVAVSEALAIPFLAPRLLELQNAHPKLRLRISTAFPRPDPMSGDADIAIQYQETKRMEAVAANLGVLHYCLFASRDYLERHGDLSNVADGVRHRVIAHTAFDEYDRAWPKKVQALNDVIDYVVTTDSSAVILHAVKAGAGLGVAPSFAAALDPDLVLIDVPPVASLRFWMVYEEGMREVARIRAAADWILDAFDRASNPWFRDEFVHPRDFGDAKSPGAYAY